MIVAHGAIDSIFERFDHELMLNQIKTKVKPYACEYILECTNLINMHEV